MKAIFKWVVTSIKGVFGYIGKVFDDLDAYDKQAKQMRREDRLGEVDYSLTEENGKDEPKENDDT